MHRQRRWKFYGNNSHAPRSLIHARPIPGSQRVLVIGSGHHTDQSGKLMRLDRSQGTQEEQGLEYVAPVRPFVPNRDDFFGQEGELFQYPLPLDEDNYLVSFNPEGGPPRGAYKTRFGIYWMNSAGDRELLVYDPAVSCGQQVPLASRAPLCPPPDKVNFDRDEGTFYLQNGWSHQRFLRARRCDPFASLPSVAPTRGPGVHGAVVTHHWCMFVFAPE